MAQTGSSISVLVVEDDKALRCEFAAVINAAPGIRLLDNAGSLAAARSVLTSRGAPDVLIVDLGLPDGDGTALIRELAARAPNANALVMTVFGDEEHVVRALEAGAKGYLLKDATPDEFAEAIRSVHEGGSPLSPMIARHVLKRFATSRNERLRLKPTARNGMPIERLTARESEILQRIAQGQTVAETAAALRVSPHTVKTHIKRVYAKLAVNNRVQAVNRARATGQLL